MLWRQLKRQSAIQTRIWLSLFLAASASALVAWTIATNKLPKQIDPNEVVIARIKLPIIPDEQHDVASSGANPEETEAGEMCISYIILAQDTRTHTNPSHSQNKRTPWTNCPSYSNMCSILNNLMGKEVWQQQEKKITIVDWVLGVCDLSIHTLNFLALNNLLPHTHNTKREGLC